ncbi:hypothetical protein PTQ21_12275 [Paenibacillus marchantiae]|uniref:hypothetical protein n=1 Tax=Paenibacillus marchantiae TaxID=3026433 RepID=UPI00237AC77E|nr:hypothetical protein [Paenibacillus marchantiae]WDQ34965.1 hypothetical protein PTQ21_12275 [Paenibacillus marchantiae]
MLQKQLTLMNIDTREQWEEWAQYRNTIGEVIKKCIERYGVNNGNLLLLGVGNGNDIPVELLESKFNNITIVDLDDGALERFLARVSDKKKFNKVIIDLSGISNQIKNAKELLNRATSIQPVIDLSKLDKTYDLVVNCCFSTQLLTSHFYGTNEFQTQSLSPKVGQKLNELSNRIHSSLFSGLKSKLVSNGVIIHMTDTFELKHNKITGEYSPAMLPVSKIIKGDWRNIHLVLNHLQQLSRDGLYILGSALPPELNDMFATRTLFSLLWEFLHDDEEDRNYIVIVYVFQNQ